MTDKIEIISGKLSNVITWASQKGCFYSIEGDNRDFYKFGPPKAKAGDAVKMEVKPGTRNFKDKMEVTSIVLAGAETNGSAELPAKAPTAPPKPVDNFKERESTRQDSIKRQCAMKAACRLVAADMKPGDFMQYDRIMAQVDAVTNGLVDIINGKDIEEEEMGEEHATGGMDE